MSNWIISYRHYSYDRIGENGRGEPGFEGDAIEITEKHPARWLLDTAKRYASQAHGPMAGEHFRRVTKVTAIISAIEVPSDLLDRQGMNELKDTAT